MDGNDPLAVYEAAVDLADARATRRGASLLECKTFKWTDSGNHLRLPKDEAEAWQRDRDPVSCLRAAAARDGCAGRPAGRRSSRARVEARVEAAIAFARCSPEPARGWAG